MGFFHGTPLCRLYKIFHLIHLEEGPRNHFPSGGGVKINVEHFEIFKMASKMAARPNSIQENDSISLNNALRVKILVSKYRFLTMPDPMKASKTMHNVYLT